MKISVSELKKGNMISFIYHGGTHPGTVRRVCIANIKDDTIHGFDIDKKAFRNYKSYNMTDIMISGNTSLDELLCYIHAQQIYQQLCSKYHNLTIDMVKDMVKIQKCKNFDSINW